MLTWPFFFWLTLFLVHFVCSNGSLVRLPLARRNLPFTFGRVPLSFLTGDAEVSLDREFVRGYPRMDMAIPYLNAHTHPPRWVEERSADLADFQGKGNPKPEFNLSKCARLKDNIDIGLESVRCETSITILFQSMIGEAPSRRFISGLDFRHYASISTDNRFTF